MAGLTLVGKRAAAAAAVADSGSHSGGTAGAGAGAAAASGDGAIVLHFLLLTGEKIAESFHQDDTVLTIKRRLEVPCRC